MRLLQSACMRVSVCCACGAVHFTEASPVTHPCQLPAQFSSAAVCMAFQTVTSTATTQLLQVVDRLPLDVVSFSPPPYIYTSKAVAGHVRSASVPCHTHPLLADVDDQLLALRSWTSNPGPKYPLSIAHVRALLCVLDELLRLPLAQAALASSHTVGADYDGFAQEEPAAAAVQEQEDGDG